MNNMQKSFKRKSALRCMADGGLIYKDIVGGVQTFTDKRAKTAGAQLYTPMAMRDVANQGITSGGVTTALPPSAMPVSGPAPAGFRPPGQSNGFGPKGGFGSAPASGGNSTYMAAGGGGTTGSAPSNIGRGRAEIGANRSIASNPIAGNPIASNPIASNPIASNLIASNPIASNPIASNPIAGKLIGAGRKGIGANRPEIGDLGYPIMTSTGYASGGKVRGPGGPTEDKIPAMLSDGEYVLPADTVKKVGVQNLDALKDATHTRGKSKLRGSVRKFAVGGYVQSAEEIRRAALEAQNRVQQGLPAPGDRWGSQQPAAKVTTPTTNPSVRPGAAFPAPNPPAVTANVPTGYGTPRTLPAGIEYGRGTVPPGAPAIPQNTAAERVINDNLVRQQSAGIPKQTPQVTLGAAKPAVVPAAAAPTPAAPAPTPAAAAQKPGLLSRIASSSKNTLNAVKGLPGRAMSAAGAAAGSAYATPGIGLALAAYDVSQNPAKYENMANQQLIGAGGGVTVRFDDGTVVPVPQKPLTDEGLSWWQPSLAAIQSGDDARRGISERATQRAPELQAAADAEALAKATPASGAPASGAPASGAPASGAPASGAPASGGTPALPEGVTQRPDGIYQQGNSYSNVLGADGKPQFLQERMGPPTPGDMAARDRLMASTPEMPFGPIPSGPGSSLRGGRGGGMRLNMPNAQDGINARFDKYASDYAKNYSGGNMSKKARTLVDIERARADALNGVMGNDTTRRGQDIDKARTDATNAAGLTQEGLKGQFNMLSEQAAANAAAQKAQAERDREMSTGAAKRHVDMYGEAVGREAYQTQVANLDLFQRMAPRGADGTVNVNELDQMSGNLLGVLKAAKLPANTQIVDIVNTPDNGSEAGPTKDWWYNEYALKLPNGEVVEIPAENLSPQDEAILQKWQRYKKQQEKGAK